ncbi:MAG: ABC transporter ATP-binding protein [Phycisphaerales bacterium]
MIQRSAAIEMKGVCLQRGEQAILSDITWTLRQGEVAAILGPNGSGKTTLTRVIAGYEWPSGGEVRVLGQTLGHTDMRELRKRVQVLNPSARFGVDDDLTAVDAVLTGYFASLALYEQVSDAQMRRADHLLDVLGMSDRKGHRFGQLSTGEQRRVLLARSLVEIPDILILDEPTAGLDVNAREHLLATIDQLRHLPNAPAVITITHHVEEISPNTGQVVMLKRGRVVAAGRPEQVISPETLSELFDCKVFVQRRSKRYWLEVLPEAWVDLLNGSRSGGHDTPRGLS